MENKAKKKEYNAKYHKINRERNLKRMKEWWANRTPEQKERRKEWNNRPENKAKKKEYNAENHKINRERNLKRFKERLENLTPEQKELERLRGKQRTVNGNYKNYHRKNKEKRNAQSKQWHLDHPTYRSEWSKTNPINRLRIEQRYAKKHSMFYTKMALKSWGDFIKYLFPRCIICASTEKLEAHHVKPRAQFPELALEPDNGVSLCKKCHNEITQLLKKVYQSFSS